MKVRRLIQGSVCLSLIAIGSIASAGGWHNGITRKLGIWYSDGYHAQEGCPSEKIGVWKHSGRAHYRDGHEYADHREHASPFADQYRPHGRPIHGGPVYDEPFYGGEPAESLAPGEPTPAAPKAPIMPTAPNDPTMPTPNGHSEARLPSSMFPLAPIR